MNVVSGWRVRIIILAHHLVQASNVDSHFERRVCVFCDVKESDSFLSARNIEQYLFFSTIDILDERSTFPSLPVNERSAAGKCEEIQELYFDIYRKHH